MSVAARVQRYRLDVHADRGDASDLIYRPPDGVALPDFASNAVRRAPIRDQGEEGSCGAFSGRYAMADMRARKGHAYVELAPQALYHAILMVENGTAANDTGCQIRSIPKALAKYGICQEAIWPYDKHPFSQALSAKAAADAARFKAVQYLRVPSVYALRYAIAIDKLTVLSGVSVYQSMMSDAVAKTGMVPVPTKGDKLAGGHALEIDEYDFRPGAAVFTGPNSWGDDWGASNTAPSAAGHRRGIYHMPLAFVQSADCLNDLWVVLK